MEVLFVDLVEILHSGEGGDVEQWLEPRIKFYCVCDCFPSCSLLSYILILVLTLALSSLLYSFHILVFSVYTHINKEAIKHLNSSFRGIKEEKF